MFVTTIVPSVLLAGAFVGSAAAKLASNKQSMQIRDRLGVTPRLWRAVGVLELTAAIGVVIGLAVPALGIAAAAGLILLLVGAIGAHARAHDMRHAAPAVLLLLITIGVAVVRCASI
jgi:uncharacterized membrane protein YphA (DoxX/SURF4 family)